MFELNKYLDEHYRFGLGNEKRELLLQGNDLYDRFHYRLKDDDMPSLCIFLATCEVWYLDVCYNRITDKGLYTLVKYFKESSHELISLNLMCNDISSEGIQIICDAGSDLKIKTLRLNGNKFGAEGGKALSTFLLQNDYLQNLDIGETDQNIESIVYIAAILRSPDVRLKSINLSRPLINFSEAHAAEVLGQMLFMNVHLKELILEKCGLTDHDIELLALGLHKYVNERFVLPTADPPAVKYKEVKSCSSYETVTSIEKYLEDRGLVKRKLKNDDPCKTLHNEARGSGQVLEENEEDTGDHETTEENDKIIESGVKAIETTSLKSLPNSYNETGVSDADQTFTVEKNKEEYFWDFMKNKSMKCTDDGKQDSAQYDETVFNPHRRVIAYGSFVSYLRHLDLSCNHLSDFAIGFLGPYFLSKPPLVILNLGFNLIGDVGAVELSRYLPSTIIEVLDISHNVIDCDGIQNLIYRMKQHSTMRKLYIWGNRTDDAVCKYLKEVIESGNILQENIDMKIYQVDGVDYAAFNQECGDVRAEYYCVRKIPIHSYSDLSPCMQRLQETMRHSVIER